MAYRRTKATEEHKAQRRQLLLDTAIKLFGKHGYHATTVPMIFAKAKCSNGGFYIYFRNKEDVFNAVLEELGQKMAEALKEVEVSQSDPFKSITQRQEALFLYLARNPQEARILIVESAGLSPRLEKTRRAIITEREEYYRQTLESAPSLFAVENTSIAARCMVGGVSEALYCWLREDPKKRMPAIEVARAVAQFNSQALRKAPVKAE